MIEEPMEKMQFVEDAINKMFEFSGKPDVTFEDIKDSNWNNEVPYYHYYFYTEKQRSTWREWFIKEMLKRFNTRKDNAIREFDKFDFVYGLSHSGKLKNV